ncbi:peptide ABC transporter ATP-binding protein [Halorubrum sp. JWXQ-INN 858]|uniref:peptide ABC transporter ATP-binding protein n=1 Tax=Halorubrum sp. JWXQ-INN 858 TaxID=2690782 RepID=UPI0013F9337E|nr:peptide ABC transporter ATP-binding protein [Halorubrum sp. JWXQ-INN 858]MWV65179.1 peptide ABC transporter ATP-binding protein [Halorubrum sp. JWXQ-INN 858]
MSTTERGSPLAVVTEDLTLTVDGVPMAVRSTGERLFVEVPTVRAAVEVARELPDSAGLVGPDRLLRTADLTLEFRVRGRTVALIGAAARPGRLARRIGAFPAEVRLAGLIGAGGDGVLATAATCRRLLGR